MRTLQFRAIVAVLGFTAVLYGLWGWNGAIGSPFADGPNYLMMAQHYSPYEKPDPVYAEAATYARFPPLYPMLLAILDADSDLYRVHLIGVACFLLALGVLYAWLRQHELPGDQSALVVLAFAALPGSWFACLNVQSEYPYLFLSSLALLLMAKHEHRPRRETLYAAALATTAAVLTRAAGVTLLVPLLVLAYRNRRGAGGYALLLALLPLLGWHVLHRAPVGYVDSFSMVYGNGWNGVLHQLTTQLPALRKGFSDNFLGAAPLCPLTDVLGLLCLAGCAGRAVRLRLDAVYLATHLALLALWPYPEEAQRFTWVLVPLLLAQPLLCLAAWRRTPVGPALSLCTTSAAAAMLAMSLPALADATERYRAATDSEIPDARGYASWYRDDPKHAELRVSGEFAIINAMREMRKYVSESDCAVSTRPDLVNFYGHRRSEFPPPNSMPDPYFEPALRLSGCRYVFGMSATDRRFPAALHPLLRLGSDVDILYVSSLPYEVGQLTVVAALAHLRH